MNMTIYPHLLEGTIWPPPSKSQGHRLLIAGALSKGISVVDRPGNSRDIQATRACLRALGVTHGEFWDGRIWLDGPRPKGIPTMPCGESGSTLRMMIPLTLVLTGGGDFTGEGRLMSRPLEPYLAIFREQGIEYTMTDYTLRIRGTLRPGTFRLPGNVSSQFITGLLLALPMLDGDSDIELTTSLESASYIAMTVEALALYDVKAYRTEKGWHVPGNQKYRPRSVPVEGDWSQAAFFEAAVFLGNPLEIKGMNWGSLQGDRVVENFIKQMKSPDPLTLRVEDCPDLVPALAVAAAYRDGCETKILGAARLRLKESDRLSAVTEVLNAIGGDVTELPDGLVIQGHRRLLGGARVSSWNDHRIAMMAAMAATRCFYPVTITGAECVEKSYPDFWKDYEALGAELEVKE